jgi:DNA-binding beta-propeller fold protein YncE
LARHLALATLASLALAAPLAARAQPVEVSFLYKLSSTTGVIPFHGLTVFHEPTGNETVVVGGGRVHIFNPTGMELYSFGDDPQLGGIVAATPVDGGDFLLLSYTGDEAPSIVLANFRGEFKARIDPKGLPDDVPRPFRPSAIGWAQGKIYLADLAGMRVVKLDMEGNFVALHDLGALCDVADKRTDNGVKGFRVAPNGDILFTVQPLFRAFILKANGDLQSFGVRGSAPGKFNIITGIARDDRGYTYVVDILKSAVIVFDKDFRFVKEFGYRGNRPGSLIAPVDIAAGDGKVFVSQFARKGVSVFAVKVLGAP